MPRTVYHHIHIVDDDACVPRRIATTATALIREPPLSQFNIVVTLLANEKSIYVLEYIYTYTHAYTYACIDLFRFFFTRTAMVRTHDVCQYIYNIIYSDDTRGLSCVRLYDKNDKNIEVYLCTTSCIYIYL